jgi:hypothetical protein
MQDGHKLVAVQQAVQALLLVEGTDPVTNPAEFKRAFMRNLLAQAQEVRPSLVWFASIMERKLRKHDSDKPWDVQPVADILDHLDSELGELRLALAHGDRDEVTLEAADVANCVHVLADRLNGCPFGPRGKGV